MKTSDQWGAWGRISGRGVKSSCPRVVYACLVLLTTLFVSGCSEGVSTDASATQQNQGSQNSRPVAIGDAVSTAEDVALTLPSLLSNDYDNDSDVLSISAFDSTTLQGGSVQKLSDTLLRYTPAANFFGEDSFNYQVSDGQSSSLGRVTITVTAVNDQPVAVADYSQTTRDTSFTTVNVLLNDSDVDGDNLTISDFNTTSIQGGTVTSYGDGTFQFSPSSGYSGSDSFNYTVSDPYGGISFGTVTITINPFNTAPTAGDDFAQTEQNTQLTLGTLLSNDNDVDGDNFFISSFDSTSSNGANITQSINDVNRLYFSPANNFQGMDSFTYTISDSSGSLDTATVTISVLAPNQAPIAKDDRVITSIGASIDDIDVIANDIDPEDDVLSVLSFDVQSLQNGVVSKNANGGLSYVPASGFTGNDTFSYTINDPEGATSSASVSIDVIALNDPNRFLAFQNTSSAIFQENTTTALAYYAAIDPENEKITLANWYIENGFNLSQADLGADAYAVYVNATDLGFARNMVMKINSDSSVASCVENYSTIAQARDRQGVIATVCMEYNSKSDDGKGKKFTKFYTFGADGNRALGADLDGRGFKFQPGLCNICHGGRPSALVSGIYPNDGDTKAGFIPWDLNNLEFSTSDTSLTRAVQENQFKRLNQGALATYDSKDNRPQVELIEGWYGGSGLPSSLFNGGFVPSGWRVPTVTNQVQSLYTEVVAPSCRPCHNQRGTPEQSDIDFSSYTKFISYAQRIEALTYNAGSMPLALLTFDRFWASNNPKQYQNLASLLPSGQISGANGTTLKPGRPIAKAGLSLQFPLASVPLNGKASLFADSFRWRMLAVPQGSQATLGNATASLTTLQPDLEGDYLIELVVAKAGINSAPAEVTITVVNGLVPVSFNNELVPIFNGQCAGSSCHSRGKFTRFAFVTDAYPTIQPLTNLNNPLRSVLLTKANGEHHSAGAVSGFRSTSDEGYEKVLRWILNGAPNN